MSPLVSIVVPSYNHGLFIQECIQSIIDQDYENIELIIIDDGSSDDSVQKIEDMAEACQNRFIRFEFRHRPNKGLCATLNEALDLAHGKYISIIASDDLMDPEKTNIQINFLEKNKACSGVFSGAKIIKETGTIDIIRSGSEQKYFFKDIILNNYRLFSPSGTYRLKELVSLGGYKENLILEDWYMFLKISENFGYLYALYQPLISYRRHEKNTSNNTPRLHEDRKKILELFKNAPQYQQALIALDYTIGIESVSFNKKKSIYFLSKSVFKNPSLFLRKRTIITIIKLFIPKHFLLKRIKGK